MVYRRANIGSVGFFLVAKGIVYTKCNDQTVCEMQLIYELIVVVVQCLCWSQNSCHVGKTCALLQLC